MSPQSRSLIDVFSFHTDPNLLLPDCSTSLRTPLERALVYPPLFSFLGAFLGAFPIALDWDRPWQAWPLTPLTGAILGCVAGNYYSFALSAWETALELGAEAEAQGPTASTSTPVKKQAAKKSVAGGAKGKVKKA